MHAPGRILLELLQAALVAVLVGPAPAAAIEFWDGRAQLHGFGEIQLRGLADKFEPGHAYTSQWANILNLEGELDLAPRGAGPFELVQLFTRVEIRTLNLLRLNQIPFFQPNRVGRIRIRVWLILEFRSG